jgi:hypothetical protein
MIFPCLLSSFFLIFYHQTIPRNAAKLIAVYPNSISHYADNKLYFKDGTSLVYNDGKKKTLEELMSNPDIEDHFHFKYSRNFSEEKTDAGRIRNEDFFKKIYGSTKKEVESNLTTIVWCPVLVNQKIKVSTVNGFDEVMRNLSNELDQHPEFIKFITNIAGTYVWRKIAGTNRLSNHAFGMTIDLNIKYANYWQWDCKCQNEYSKLSYKNSIPKKLVEIFEKHGFIWGGKWKHYDTMHFEYRPEFF